jgi:hypothetical protein
MKQQRKIPLHNETCGLSNFIYQHPHFIVNMTQLFYDQQSV